MKGILRFFFINLHNQDLLHISSIFIYKHINNMLHKLIHGDVKIQLITHKYHYIIVHMICIS